MPTPIKQDPSNIATTKLTIEGAYAALITGIETDLANVTTFLLNGQSYGRDALLAKFQSRIDASKKSKASKSVWHQDVEAEHELDVEVAPLRKAMKSYVEAGFGKNSSKAQDFGFGSRRPRKAKAATKATAVAKAAKTKTARGIMGKNQRKKIVAPAAPSNADASPNANADANGSGNANGNGSPQPPPK